MMNIINEIKFAIYAIKQNIKSSAELRSSFLISLFGMMINNVSFLIVWMSFGKIAGNMGGWNYIDFLLANGLVSIGFGICYGFFGGLRYFPDLVRFGIIDKFLLSPKNIISRIATSQFEASALGDLIFGIICILLWMFFTGNYSLFIIINILFFIVISTLIFFFYGLFSNSLSFYFANGNTIVNGMMEMLLTPAIFYGGAFQGILKKIFIFIIPALLLGNISVEIIKYPSFKMYFTVLLITVFWILLSILFFKRSLKRYESSNFINFG